MSPGHSVSYTWDNNGNLLNDGVRSYAYDHANRLAQVSDGTLTTQFTYNGDGDRLAKTVDGVTTDYVLDPAAGLTQVLVESTGGQQTAYLYGHDLLAQYDSGTWAYHLNDGLGSVRQLADVAGEIQRAQSYDPFGNLLSASGSAESAYGYTGEQEDASAGLVFLRARYYDPITGQFLTKDPNPGSIYQPQTLNPYVYVLNNPVNDRDPSGEQGENEQDGKRLEAFLEIIDEIPADHPHLTPDDIYAAAAFAADYLAQEEIIFAGGERL